MSEKAVHNHKCRQNSAGNVGRLGGKPRIPPNNHDQYRQREYSEKNAAAVHAYATDPFSEVVALGFEYEPFVAEVLDRDVQQTRNHRGGDITVWNHWAENCGKKCERAVPEKGIPGTHHHVTPELAGRNVEREFRAPFVRRI